MCFPPFRRKNRAADSERDEQIIAEFYGYKGASGADRSAVASPPSSSKSSAASSNVSSPRSKPGSRILGRRNKDVDERPTLEAIGDDDGGTVPTVQRRGPTVTDVLGALPLEEPSPNRRRRKRSQASPRGAKSKGSMLSPRSNRGVRIVRAVSPGFHKRWRNSAGSSIPDSSPGHSLRYDGRDSHDLSDEVVVASPQAVRLGRNSVINMLELSFPSTWYTDSDVIVDMNPSGRSSSFNSRSQSNAPTARQSRRESRARSRARSRDVTPRGTGEIAGPAVRGTSSTASTARSTRSNTLSGTNVPSLQLGVIRSTGAPPTGRRSGRGSVRSMTMPHPLTRGTSKQNSHASSRDSSPSNTAPAISFPTAPPAPSTSRGSGTRPALTPKSSGRSVRYAPQPVPAQPVVTPANTQSAAVITRLASEINEALASGPITRGSWSERDSRSG
eukprot:CAMPEP_0170743652 /NCGR_PEP_ID=MMETSP0437-20130122/7378_1 /TAXON_ID=0 /ORGANISM="Sexangularia sp." /LENGTH=443 /DNA_ID=CAMNT_0011082327 /DNA_START=28 /DNA_END=1359 /DNA_ORIENTATION=-